MWQTSHCAKWSPLVPQMGGTIAIHFPCVVALCHGGLLKHLPPHHSLCVTAAQILWWPEPALLELLRQCWSWTKKLCFSEPVTTPAFSLQWLGCLCHGCSHGRACDISCSMSCRSHRRQVYFLLVFGTRRKPDSDWE